MTLFAISLNLLLILLSCVGNVAISLIAILITKNIQNFYWFGFGFIFHFSWNCDHFHRTYAPGISIEKPITSLQFTKYAENGFFVPRQNLGRILCGRWHTMPNVPYLRENCRRWGKFDHFQTNWNFAAAILEFVCVTVKCQCGFHCIVPFSLPFPHRFPNGVCEWYRKHLQTIADPKIAQKQIEYVLRFVRSKFNCKLIERKNSKTSVFVSAKWFRSFVFDRPSLRPFHICSRFLCNLFSLAFLFALSSSLLSAVDYITGARHLKRYRNTTTIYLICCGVYVCSFNLHVFRWNVPLSLTLNIDLNRLIVVHRWIIILCIHTTACEERNCSSISIWRKSQFIKCSLLPQIEWEATTAQAEEKGKEE